MKKILLLICAAFCLSGCGSMKVVPDAIESGVVSAADNSLTVTKDGISMTAKNADINMFSANLEGAVAAFSVLVENQTDGEIAFAPESFLLLDNDNRQYAPLTPEKVKEIVSQDSYYLIPYPYVGFYYLEDYQKTSFYNRFNTREPYFYELYPQDIFTKGFPAGAIIPKAKVAGLVYFKIDLSEKQAVRLLAFRNKGAKSSAPDFVFPFRIIK